MRCIPLHTPVGGQIVLELLLVRKQSGHLIAVTPVRDAGAHLRLQRASVRVVVRGVLDVSIVSS